MIFAISGKIERFTDDSLVISTNSGLDYEVFVTCYDQAKFLVGSEVKLYIHEVIREDSYTLYGFALESSLKIFVELLKVNGIGPKVAMTLLSQLTVPELVSCVRSQNLTALTSVKGLGRKGAEKLLLALRDKWVNWLKIMPNEIPIIETKPIDIEKTPSYITDANEALVTLGYDRKNVQKLVSKIAEETSDTKEIITRALRKMSELV